MVAERIVHSETEYSAPPVSMTDTPVVRGANGSVQPRPLSWNFEQFRQMHDLLFFEDRRVELIEGEIIEMAAMNGPHWAAVAQANKILSRLFGDYVVAPQLPLKLSEVSAPVPDFSIVSGAPGDFVKEIATGALLCLEISDSTLRYDRTQKAVLYAKAGIPEYWILDLKQRRLEVFLEPVGDAESGGVYTQTHIFSETGEVAPHFAPDIKIKVADLLPKL